MEQWPSKRQHGRRRFGSARAPVGCGRTSAGCEGHSAPPSASASQCPGAPARWTICSYGEEYDIGAAKAATVCQSLTAHCSSEIPGSHRQNSLYNSQSDIFTLASNDTDICINARQYQTSAYGSTDFRDHWYWKSVRPI